MTRLITWRFRRLVFVAAIGAGALGLALGTASIASASTTGGYPTPAPTSSQYKHHEPPEVCFYSLETEHDVIPNQQGDDQYGQQNYGQQGDQKGQKDEREAVEVVQLVQVCVTDKHQGDKVWNEGNKDDDVVTVRDVTGPFAWIEPASGPAPTPDGLPSSIAGMLAA